MSGASCFGRSPSDYKSGATHNEVRLRGLSEPAQVGFVCIAAISNRSVFLPKVDAPIVSTYLAYAFLLLTKVKELTTS